MLVALRFKLIYSLSVCLFFQEGNALECLSCHGITPPRNCDVTTTCGVDEVCYAESVTSSDGLRAYILGCTARDPSTCRHQQYFTCSECCDYNLCNAQLCGEQGYPADRGPICYKCNSRLISEPCNIINFCGQHEMCAAPGAPIVGKKRDADSHYEDSDPYMCESCCSGDLCNTYCDQAAQSFCQGKADGSFRDPMNCSYFYVCTSLYIDYHDPCPLGTYYSNTLQGCDWATNVPGCP